MGRFNEVTLLNGDVYDVGISTGVEFIYGTQVNATNTWTGVTKDSELYDGKQIVYYLPYAGSGDATLNLTLSTGTATGAKGCYFNGTTALSTQYGQYSHIHLIYHSALNIGGTDYEGWWVINNSVSGS